MGTVIHLSKRSSGSTDTSQCPRRIDEVLMDLGAITSGIAVMENRGETLVRCINALQKSIEAFDGIHSMVADSGEHEQFVRWTKSTNSKLQSELTKLASILRAARLADERVRRIDRSPG